jgi:NCAIR mutase (PurE)-related protein
MYEISKLHNLLEQVYSHRITIDQALDRLRNLPYDELDGYAKLDTHRELRQGTPEVVFCQGKTPDQVLGIMQRLMQHHKRVMGTRANHEMAKKVTDVFAETKYDPISRIITIDQTKKSLHSDTKHFAVVVTGGTSDLPVAEEAAQTIEFLNSTVKRAYDVGVAGIHRLLNHRDLLFSADIIISVAGMEGALTSVVGGLVSCPVIGVPTSIGYGASFNGLAALLSMLNSCAAGVAVVNIDNGFGAGILAHKILSRLR